MAKQINDEYKLFIKDIEKNIKNKDDVEYIKRKLNKFSDSFMTQLEDLNARIEEKECQLQDVINKQKQFDRRLEKVQQIINNIENDIYDEDGFDFEIVCPYCNSEFLIDVDDNNNEVQCPECHNTIELDWTGKQATENYTCDGACSTCKGCQDDEETDKDLDDDM